MVKPNELDFIMTRHAYSCNNLLLDKSPFDLYKKTGFLDPGLTMYGILTTLFKSISVNDGRYNSNKVFVSCLYRTWLTAILLYLPNVDGEGLTLIISPYLKETHWLENLDAGNLPLDIVQQLMMLVYFFDTLRNIKAALDVRSANTAEGTEYEIILHLIKTLESVKNKKLILQFSQTTKITINLGDLRLNHTSFEIPDDVKIQDINQSFPTYWRRYKLINEQYKERLVKQVLLLRMIEDYHLIEDNNHVIKDKFRSDLLDKNPDDLLEEADRLLEEVNRTFGEKIKTEEINDHEYINDQLTRFILSKGGDLTTLYTQNSEKDEKGENIGKSATIIGEVQSDPSTEMKDGSVNENKGSNLNDFTIIPSTSDLFETNLDKFIIWIVKNFEILELTSTKIHCVTHSDALRKFISKTELMSYRSNGPFPAFLMGTDVVVSTTINGSPEHKQFIKTKSDNKKKSFDNHKLSDRNVWDLRFSMVRLAEYEKSKQLFKLVDIVAYHGIIKPKKSQLSRLCELNCGYGYRTGRITNTTIRATCTKNIPKQDVMSGFTSSPELGRVYNSSPQSSDE